MAMHLGLQDPCSQYNFEILKFQDGRKPSFENENRHLLFKFAENVE